MRFSLFWICSISFVFTNLGWPLFKEYSFESTFHCALALDFESLLNLLASSAELAWIFRWTCLWLPLFFLCIYSSLWFLQFFGSWACILWTVPSFFNFLLLDELFLSHLLDLSETYGLGNPGFPFGSSLWFSYSLHLTLLCPHLTLLTFSSSSTLNITENLRCPWHWHFCLIRASSDWLRRVPAGLLLS